MFSLPAGSSLGFNVDMIHWSENVRRFLLMSYEGESWDSFDVMVRVWDVITGTEVLALRLSNVEEVIGVDWNRDEPRILTGSFHDGTGVLRVWDMSNGKELLSMHFEGYVAGGTWTTSGRNLLIWAGDMIQIRDGDSLEEKFTVLDENVVGAVWNSDESRFSVLVGFWG
ncbi:MAG: WD40 repeat domain-containing protein [Anaerolineae bacterium]|nr:WD40 repeat domain-containing protein [Anaerolineae bacterium]